MTSNAPKSEDSTSTHKAPMSPTSEATPAPSPAKTEHKKMVSLSPTDLAAVRRAIGAVSEVDEESSILAQPKSKIYAPKGLPQGLYRDVVASRTSCQYQYFFCAAFFNVSLVLQLLLGASVTALSSTSASKLIITILAGANTVNAGLLALMHNSGMPDRLKNDWIEFEKVEIHLEEIANAGIAPEGMTREDVISRCYEKYAEAKATVNRNMPTSYTATPTDSGVTK